jgi:hypothetical protein
VPTGEEPSVAIALGCLVGHGPDRLDLRVEHLVHGDEVGAHDVPVHVLQRQGQVVERVQPVLQQRGDRLAVLGRHPGNGVAGRGGGHVVLLLLLSGVGVVRDQP